MVYDLLVGKTFPEHNKRLRELCRREERINLVNILDNGNDLVEFVKNNTVDVLILDLILHEKDGFFVLDELNNIPKRPLTIVYTPLTCSHIVRRALIKGADYYYYDSVDVSYILKRARLIAKEMPLINRPEEAPSLIDEQVMRTLHKIEFHTHLKGYFYLKDGISACLRNDDLLQSITKALYVYIGEKHGTTPSGVEKAIRHSIDCYWKRNGYQNMRKILPHYVSLRRPTNGEFMRLMVDFILAQQCGML